VLGVWGGISHPARLDAHRGPTGASSRAPPLPVSLFCSFQAHNGKQK
jgi:hypothetical protein